MQRYCFKYSSYIFLRLNLFTQIHSLTFGGM